MVMRTIIVRKVKDRYNTRIPAEGLDLLGIKEGDSYEVLENNQELVIRKFNQEATA